MLPSRLTLGAIVALLVLAGNSAAATTTSAHPAASRIQAKLGRALASPYVDSRQTGAVAVDLRTGQLVFQHNGALPLVPASAEKLPVAFAALRELGPDFRFHTEVLGSGRLVGGEWRGDLYLVGHGDPTLAVADVGRLARDLKAAGIRRVKGGVVADERHFDARRTAPGWKPSFLGIESPPLSALVVRGVPLIGANSSATAAASALSAALGRRGVTITAGPRTGRAPRDASALAVDHSAKLGLIVQHMNRESDNFVAEMLLKELGASVKGSGSTRSGARVVRRVLEESDIPTDGLRVADGSGLSRLDRLSARTLVALLRAAAADAEIGGTFVSSLPVAGVSGTMENRLGKPPTRRRVIAKTGTTSRACALVGFVGRRYAFAVIQNGSPVSFWSARTAQDRFVTVLARS
jgi:D-alanyl-D-alanine carboxypeptidase/D-alanyl-D-alanine-endopeptidase (penicillin-binding protein 4)